MKKLVMLIISILLITGCSVKYDLVINDDLTIEEESNVTGTKDLFSTYYKTTKKKVLQNILDVYKEDLDKNNYSYELIEDTIPYVKITKKYNNIKEYIDNSKLFNGYFDEIKYTEDGSIIKMETVGYYPNEEYNQDRFDVTNLEISIKCPYVVKNHNANKFDKNTNTYYFTLDENSDYKILFEFDSSKKFNPYSDLIRTIALCIASIIGIWLIVYILNKNQGKNK